MVEILSKSTQNIVQKPEVREAIHTLLNRDDKAGSAQATPVSVTIDGTQVQVTRVPAPQSGEPKG